MLSTITARYGDVPCVAGIELLNEPAGFSIPESTIMDFYDRGYSVTQSPDRVTVLHDAFLPLTDFSDKFVQGAYQNVALDTHVSLVLRLVSFLSFVFPSFEGIKM